MYEIDEEQIRLWWSIFKSPDRLAEIRLLGGKSSFSGYFKTADSLISNIRYYLEKETDGRYTPLQAYCIFNDIDEALYGREQHERFVNGAKTTKDDNILKRNFVLVDLDPERVSGVSASNEEFEYAHLKAVDVYKYLIGVGFSEPIICVSGNGYHLYVSCDMPNDDAHHTLVNNFLKSLGNMFSDSHVDIDQSVGNAANLTKLMGTWAKKGSCTQDRPWRQSRFVKVPNEIKVNDDSLFQKIADLLPKEEPKQTQKVKSFNERFDLEQWLNTYGIEFRKKQDGSSTKYEIKTCPWHTTHSVDNPYSSAIYQDADGKVTYTCAHSHCRDKQWKDFRLYYQPDAYDKPSYQPQYRQYIPTIPTKPKYEIKEEIPELGEKWMSLSSVEKVDLTKLEKVKTGFTELDNRVGGLYMSEVTILSGSNASGKSSWLNSVILNIIQQNYKVALWSGELRADILKSWIQMVAAGKDNLRPSQFEQGQYYVPDSIGSKIDAWLDGKFFLYNNKYGNVASQVLYDIKILTKAGVKVFVIDNMMSMNIDVFDGDKNEKQKQFILALKDFAMEEQVHVILVAHPRKSVAFLRKTDISGSGDIINAVDNCFIFHRVNEDFIHAITEFYDAARASQLRQYGNVLAVEKNRLRGVVDLMVGMQYEIESRRFKNYIDEDIHYDWENIGVQQTFQSALDRSINTLQNTFGGMEVVDNNQPFGSPQLDNCPF
jgi:archaellum biogenesis ATPase FlaH